MITRCDQAVLAVDDLAAATAVLSLRIGLSVQEGGRHTGFGTDNAVVRFGLDYLQIASIVDRDEAAATGMKRAPMLRLLAQRRGGWLAYGMATDDIDALAERFRQVGLDAVGPYAMRRERPDGRVLRWRLLQPGGTALRRPWPFFIQWDTPDAELLAAEPLARHELGATKVTGVSVIVSELKAAQYLYGEQLGLKYEGCGAHDTPGASAACYSLGHFRVELIAPTAPGPMLDRLERQGEGLCEVRLGVDNLPEARRLIEGRGGQLVAHGDGSVEVCAAGLADFGACIRIEQATSDAE